ncbi:MAG: FHA domain-containing protein [Cyanobacteria bacterium P01_F01_bin.150]
MIVCPNCSHHNPAVAIQCEACYTPLPSMVSCPVCSASVQSDASFCGQCGANLSVAMQQSPSVQSSLEEELVPLESSDPGNVNLSESQSPSSTEQPAPVAPSLSGQWSNVEIPEVTVPDLAEFEALVEPEPLTPDLPDLESSSPVEMSELVAPHSQAELNNHEPFPSPAEPNSSGFPELRVSLESPAPSPFPSSRATQIQRQSLQFIHTYTNTAVEVPPNLSVVHIGKPNDRVPPDIDVSGFKDSEVVSRVHADLRLEGDSYYIEDVGSSNGTYVNNIPLMPGNRHMLRAGDRIALGKGDKVSFIVQIV